MVCTEDLGLGDSLIPAEAQLASLPRLTAQAAEDVIGA